MDFTKLIDYLKIPTKALTALCLFFAILLFSGKTFLASLGLFELIEKFRAYIGAGFLLSLSIIAVNAIASLATFIKPWVVQYYLIKEGQKHLKALTPEEKQILKYYIKNNTKNQTLDFMNGTVNLLQQNKIIVRISNVGSASGFDYVIQPWAWDYLRTNTNLLDD